MLSKSFLIIEEVMLLATNHYKQLDLSINEEHIW